MKIKILLAIGATLFYLGITAGHWFPFLMGLLGESK